MKECLPKINKQTGKVDLSAYEGVSDIGTPNVKLWPDDMAVLVESSWAVDVEEAQENGQRVTYSWFKDSVDMRIVE